MDTKEETVRKSFVQEGDELYEYPVVAVSAFDAIYFCNKLSELKGLDPVYKVNGETDVTKWKYTPHEGYGIPSQMMPSSITSLVLTMAFMALPSYSPMTMTCTVRLRARV